MTTHEYFVSYAYRTTNEESGFGNAFCASPMVDNMDILDTIAEKILKEKGYVSIVIINIQRLPI